MDHTPCSEHNPNIHLDKELGIVHRTSFSERAKQEKRWGIFHAHFLELSFINGNLHNAALTINVTSGNAAVSHYL